MGVDVTRYDRESLLNYASSVRLPTRQFEVVLLAVRDGLSLADVADQMEIDVDTVRVHLRRVRRKMRADAARV